MSKLSPANEHFLETITIPGQLRNIARAYDNRIQLSTLLGLLFTQVGLTNPNFGALGTLSATEHNLTYLLAMLAQAGGINAMNQDAVPTLTTIRQLCEGAGLYAPGAHRIILPKVTPDGQQRPGLAPIFVEGRTEDSLQMHLLLGKHPASGEERRTASALFAARLE